MESVCRITITNHTDFYHVHYTLLHENEWSLTTPALLRHAPSGSSNTLGSITPGLSGGQSNRNSVLSSAGQQSLSARNRLLALRISAILIVLCAVFTEENKADERYQTDQLPPTASQGQDQIASIVAG